MSLPVFLFLFQFTFQLNHVECSLWALSRKSSTYKLIKFPWKYRCIVERKYCKEGKLIMRRLVVQILCTALNYEWLLMCQPTKMGWCLDKMAQYYFPWNPVVKSCSCWWIYVLVCSAIHANCYRYCKFHISGSTLCVRGRLYSHMSIYLNFEVYRYVITIYGYVYKYMQRDLLLMPP